MADELLLAAVRTSLIDTVREFWIVATNFALLLQMSLSMSSRVGAAELFPGAMLSELSVVRLTL